jgi:hypothetical protein
MSIDHRPDQNKKKRTVSRGKLSRGYQLHVGEDLFFWCSMRSLLILKSQICWNGETWKVKKPTTNRVTACFHAVWFWKKEPMWCIMLWITRILTSDHPFFVSFVCCISIVLYQVLLSDDSDLGWEIMHYVFLHFYMLTCTSIIVYGK